jgi:hypothetical protein
MVWPGEEITMGLVHVNGLGLRERIPLPQEAIETDASGFALQPATLIHWAAEQVSDQGGVASVNHPNLYRGLTAQDVQQAGNARLLEISNMNAQASRSNAGDATRPATEHMWDSLIAAGQRVWGVASDDAHHFKSWGPEWSNPGRGWVMVEAEPRLDACLAALDEGRFYASTGPELADYRVSCDEVAIDLLGAPARIELVVPGGRLVQACDGQSAHFSINGDLPHARVRVTDSDGAHLWTQPFFRG